MIADADSDKALLEHILECIAHVEEYTRKGKEEYVSSIMVRDAAARKLQIMAESTQRLSEKIKSTEPSIPWRQISGFRNTLAHGYFDIDEELVWVVIQDGLPDLKSAIVRMLSKLNA